MQPAVEGDLRHPGEMGSPVYVPKVSQTPYQAKDEKGFLCIGTLKLKSQHALRISDQNH